jgi:hypothetical protein
MPVSRPEVVTCAGTIVASSESRVTTKPRVLVSRVFMGILLRAFLSRLRFLVN